MANAVYVAGFGSGPETVESVGSALEEYFDGVSAFSFSDFVTNQQAVEDVIEKSTLVTHSAGALALERLSKSPEKAILLNPPLPTPIPQLALKAVVKTARLATPGIGLKTFGDIPAVGRFSWSSLREFKSRPGVHSSQLADISHFNSVDAAVAAASRGVGVSMVWTSSDVYFRPTDSDLAKLRQAGVNTRTLPGEHDELLIRPGDFLRDVFSYIAQSI